MAQNGNNHQTLEANLGEAREKAAKRAASFTYNHTRLGKIRYNRAMNSYEKALADSRDVMHTHARQKIIHDPHFNSLSMAEKEHYSHAALGASAIVESFEWVDAQNQAIDKINSNTNFSRSFGGRNAEGERVPTDSRWRRFIPGSVTAAAEVVIASGMEIAFNSSKTAFAINALIGLMRGNSIAHSRTGALKRLPSRQAARSLTIEQKATAQKIAGGNYRVSLEELDHLKKISDQFNQFDYPHVIVRTSKNDIEHRKLERKKVAEKSKDRLKSVAKSAVATVIGLTLPAVFDFVENYEPPKKDQRIFGEDTPFEVDKNKREFKSYEDLEGQRTGFNVIPVKGDRYYISDASVTRSITISGEIFRKECQSKNPDCVEEILDKYYKEEE